MNVLLYGTVLICIAFFIHLIMWRIHVPQNQTRALLQIFFGTLIVSISVLWRFSGDIAMFGIPAPTAKYEYVQLAFFFVSLALAYISTYSALEVDSPSLVMVMNIAKAGRNGLDKNALQQKMGDDILVVPRVRDLVAGEMVSLDGDVYRLNAKGIFVARIFIAYRRLLKKTQKGG